MRIRKNAWESYELKQNRSRLNAIQKPHREFRVSGEGKQSPRQILQMGLGPLTKSPQLLVDDLKVPRMLAK